MWKHYQLTEEEPLCRPCGTFSLYAGDVLLGHSQLEWETIGDEGFLREGSFDAILESYLPFQDVFVRYQQLKVEQHFRLPAYKHMPELESCKLQIQTLHLRLVAPNGEDVLTGDFEVVDLGDADGRELNVFIADESVYIRYFPPHETNI
jgi:hypothetical protein